MTALGVNKSIKTKSGGVPVLPRRRCPVGAGNMETIGGSPRDTRKGRTGILDLMRKKELVCRAAVSSGVEGSEDR